MKRNEYTASDATSRRTTDIFRFYVVDKTRDPVAAAEALGAFLPFPGDGTLALTRGMCANTDQGQALYAAVRPHGYGVKGLDSGRVGPALRSGKGGHQ